MRDFSFFFFNDTAPTEIYTLSLHDALPILAQALGDRAVIFTAAPITLPDNSEPQPDICIAMPPESRYDQRHPIPTDIDWLIAVANSTRDYDSGKQAQLYAQHQIREYWVIDIPQPRL